MSIIDSICRQQQHNAALVFKNTESHKIIDLWQEGDLIIKPSVYRTVNRGELPNIKMYPAYGTVIRKKK